MPSQTYTYTNAYRDGDAYYPTSELSWSDLSGLSWSDYTNYGGTDLAGGGYNDMVIQIDDDLDTVKFRRPLCSFFTEGTASVTLKISDSGAFTGEETTINFSIGTPVNFVKGRYYRWIITVPNDSDAGLVEITNPTTSYEQEQRIEFFDDLALSTLSQDSESSYIVTTTSIGAVTHAQGTAHQGEDYVADTYITTPTDQAEYLRANQVTVTNTNTTISTTTKKFGTGAFEFDGTAKLEMNDTSLYDTTNDHTIEFWLNVESMLSSTDSVYVFEQTDGSTDSVFGNIQSDGAGFRFVNQIDGTPTGSRTDRTSVLNLGQWYHIAVVIEDDHGTIYVDGTLDSANVNDSVGSGNRSDFGGILNIGLTDFDGYIDDFHITQSKKYSGNFTAPGEAMTPDKNTVLLLNADDFTDNVGRNYGTDKYIEDQKGGAVVIESKNPLTLKVVDFNGDTWDGTVDLMVRGFERIQLFTDGVR